MAPPSLYRRYRPQRFREVRGQDHVVRALLNATREGRVGHAYLFSGPRGTGKTSTARILAKALNCAAPVDGEPCCECERCLAVEHGVIVDWLHELDAASNNRVEPMRELLERVPLGTSGTRKVYILDEVHMLSAGAANTLLKTLEEPPEHVVFVLATTDPQKVLPTIRSRTQHFEFHLLPASELADHVRWIIDDAGLGLGDDAVEHVLRAGGGSARDTLSALDQVAALGGVVHQITPVEGVLSALADQATGQVLVAVADAVAAGREPRVIGETVIQALRDAFLALMGAPNAQLPEGEQQRVAELGQRLGAPGLTRALEVLGEALVDMRQAADPRIALEVALVRITRPDVDRSLEAVLERLDRVERSLGASGGGAPARPAPRGRDERPRSGPADEARAELERSADSPRPAKAAPGARPALGGVRKSSRQPGASAEPDAAGVQAEPHPGVLPTERHGAVAVADAPPVRASTESLPTRDELTLVWGDSVLAGLPLQVRSKWRGGRFLEHGSSAARFALPNEWHLRECEKGRSAVESALAAQFGHPITVELVLDEVTDASSEPATAQAPADPAADPVEVIDIDELVDARGAPNSVDRVLEVFPGSEIVEEG